MNAALCIAVLGPLPLALLAPRLARKLPPGLGLWAMTAAASAAALATVWSLLLLSALLIDDAPGLSRLSPLVADPDAVSCVAVVALAVVIFRVVGCLREVRRDLRALRKLAAEDGLVVAQTSTLEAIAIPARGFRRGGSVYVTTGMLNVLTPVQRRALLAHEHAHLNSGHHIARLFAAMATAVNPALTPVRHAVAFLCERQADESAADRIGNRTLVAQALAVAALARTTAVTHVLGLHHVGVADRVTALLTPAARGRRWQLALPTAIVATSIASCLLAANDIAAVVSAVIGF